MSREGQSVLITGATSGIGLEFARLFYLKGYDLVLVGRNPERLEQAKNQLEGKGDSIVLIQSDMAQEDSAQEVYQQCKTQGLTIDILVNNAGVGLFGEHPDLPIAEVKKMIVLNITSLTVLCSLFGKEMKQRMSGYILNIASTAAYQPLPLFASYAATKSYVLNFSEALSKEMEDYNVGVTCLSPGNTDTKFFNEAGIGDKTNGFFARKKRMTAKKVAEFGIKALFSKRLSTIPGLKNKLMICSHRFATRSATAKITKGLIKKP